MGKKKQTTVINLIGGPGCGKSTICAHVFALLKWNGVECEMALEYAKEKVWESSEHILNNQAYVFGHQLQRIHRLIGKVEYVITDSPLLLSIIYAKGLGPCFAEVVKAQHKKIKSINYFVKRIKPYNPNGRLQDEAGAMDIDRMIMNVLYDMDVKYKIVLGSPDGVEEIVDDIMKHKYDG